MPIDVAAAKADLTPERLQAFEDPASGVRPTVAQLRRLARLYRKPTAFFYLEELPPQPTIPHDYRLAPEAEDWPNHETLDAVNTASQRRLDAIELSAVLGFGSPDFPVDVANRARPPAETLGAQLRAALGITMEAQRAWRGDYYKALRAWSDAAERAGALVFQYSNVDTAYGLGFSLPSRPLPVVALNGGDPWPQRKIFTLLHELAHIALGRPAVCSPREVPAAARGDDAQIERYCNEAAAAALMPREAILGNPLVQREPRDDWNEEDLNQVRRNFSVSHEALLVRLIDLGQMAPAVYAKWRAINPVPAPSRGFLKWPVRYVRDNGRKFTSMVLTAYASELLTGPEASRLLGNVKLRHLQAMRSQLP